MRTVAEIEQAWYRLMMDDRSLWTVASMYMRRHQDDGLDEDAAAERAMVDVGWLSARMSMTDQYAQEYDEILAAEDLMRP